MINLQIVWFKKDLRIFDHGPLSEAAKRGPVLPIYIVEPKLWRQPDMSFRHYAFLSESLVELNKELSKLGQPLLIFVGDALATLQFLVRKFKVQTIWSHQETGNTWTYIRDKAILRWTKSENISWYELKQFGVIRGLKSRDGWASHWLKFMLSPCYEAPKQLPFITQTHTQIPTGFELGLSDDHCNYRQKGGRKLGLALLNSFLLERGENYTRAMSSPNTAFNSCSRLSPYISFGTLSIREIFKAYQKREWALKKLPAEYRGKWPNALRSFAGRLRWHCHFIQKLEDEPRIEFENLHSAYNGLRENSFNLSYFSAWQEGKTGYPMIDACMRALIATGYLNFRMRAMLISFASHHLWLHWRETAFYLARMFTDYEPGIHYSQIQMQSCTTGINAIRIYNPIKQSMEHDPQGIFIKKWIPELVNMPEIMIHTPWVMPIFMGDYPVPIINEKNARKLAADKLYSIRNNEEFIREAKKIVKKHASRNR